MNKRYMFAFIAVLVLFLIAWVGVSIGLQWLFGVAIPYLAVLVFVVGFARKVLDGKTPQARPLYRWSSAFRNSGQGSFDAEAAASKSLPGPGSIS